MSMTAGCVISGPTKENVNATQAGWKLNVKRRATCVKANTQNVSINQRLS